MLHVFRTPECMRPFRNLSQAALQINQKRADAGGRAWTMMGLGSIPICEAVAGVIANATDSTDAVTQSFHHGKNLESDLSVRSGRFSDLIVRTS
jgi:hypothetical protein